MTGEKQKVESRKLKFLQSAKLKFLQSGKLKFLFSAFYFPLSAFRFSHFRPSFFTLIVEEPLTGEITEKRIAIAPGKSLFAHLGENWRGASISSDRRKIGGLMGWFMDRPLANERITVRPGVGAKSFSDAFIAKLNAQNTAGKFLRAVVLSIAAGETAYFIDHDAAVNYGGHNYQPLPMSWQGVEVSRQMQLPTVRVVVPNLGQQVSEYVEDHDLLERDVTLQLLHLDLLGDASAKDETLLQIQSIEISDVAVFFNLGLNLGLKDNLPRNVMLKSEFPGIADTWGRIQL